MELTVILYEDEIDGGYIVECPTLPGCMSQGDTEEEAIENIKDAIKGWLHVEQMKTNESVDKMRCGSKNVHAVALAI